MDIAVTLAQFLAANPRFQFQLYEHVYSTRYIADARARHRVFVNRLRQPLPAGNPWRLRRSEIQARLQSIPAWRGIDWERRDYEDTVPFSDKTAIRADVEAFLHPGISRGALWYRETSGTTGPPLRIWYSPAFSVEAQYSSVDKLLELADVNLSPLSPTDVQTLAIVDNQHVVEAAMTAPDGVPSLGLRVVFNERDPGSVDALYEAISRYRPRVITLKPNVLAAITSERPGARLGVPSHLSVVFCSGANLDSKLRRHAEEALGVPVIDAYGMTELGVVASECALRNGLHLYEQEAIFEVLKPDGNVSHTGGGELVVTSVRNEAMPLARYRTGDLVTVTSAPCPCRLPGRRIIKLSGRVYRNYVLPDGSLLSPTRVNRIFDDFPLREFRLTQVTHDRFELELETLPDSPDPSAVADEVRTRVEAIIGGAVTVVARLAVFSNDIKFERYRTPY